MANSAANSLQFFYRIYRICVMGNMCITRIAHFMGDSRVFGELEAGVGSVRGGRFSSQARCRGFESHRPLLIFSGRYRGIYR